MRQLICRDAGADCDFVIQGKDDDEIIRKAREHGRDRHGMMNIDPAGEQRLRGLIKNV